MRREENSMKKRFLAVILAAVMTAGLMPVGAFAHEDGAHIHDEELLVEEVEAYDEFSEEIEFDDVFEEYSDFEYEVNDDEDVIQYVEMSSASVIKSKLVEINESGKYNGKGYQALGQCWGFVNSVSKDVFGVGIPSQAVDKTELQPHANWYQVGSKATTNSGVTALLKTAQSGDIFQYKSSLVNPYHIAMIYDVDSTGITVWDNTSYNGYNVKISTCSWDRLFERDCDATVRSLGDFSASGYGLSLYRCNRDVVSGGGGHPHNYVQGYEAAHPHKVYMRCSCGDWYYTGATTTMSGCSQCYPVSNLKTGYVTGTPGNLIINSKPSAGYDIGKMPEGSACTVDLNKTSGSWYWVTYNGISGYAYSKYISFTPPTPSLSVVRTVDCERKLTNVNKTPLYRNATDTTSFVTLSSNVYSYTHAVMSDGSIRYKVGVKHQGVDMDAWISSSSGVSVETYHTYGSTQYESAHPHNGYRTCECGTKTYTGTTTKMSGCTTCYPPNPIAPNKPSVSVNGQNVTVSWNNVANETSYDVYLLQSPWGWSNIKYSKSVSANTTSCTFTNVAPGYYGAFVIARPNENTVQSVHAYFDVEEPPTVKLIKTDLKPEYWKIKAVNTGVSWPYITIRDSNLNVIKSLSNRNMSFLGEYSLKELIPELDFSPAPNEEYIIEVGGSYHDINSNLVQFKEQVRYRPYVVTLKGNDVELPETISNGDKFDVRFDVIGSNNVKSVDAAQYKLDYDEDALILKKITLNTEDYWNIGGNSPRMTVIANTSPAVPADENGLCYAINVEFEVKDVNKLKEGTNPVIDVDNDDLNLVGKDGRGRSSDYGDPVHWIADPAEITVNQTYVVTLKGNDVELPENISNGDKFDVRFDVIGSNNVQSVDAAQYKLDYDEDVLILKKITLNTEDYRNWGREDGPIMIVCRYTSPGVPADENGLCYAINVEFEVKDVNKLKEGTNPVIDVYNDDLNLVGKDGRLRESCEGDPIHWIADPAEITVKTTNQTYNVTLNSVSNGKAEVSALTAKAGQKITVTATPNSDAMLSPNSSPVVTGASGTVSVSGNGPTWTFVMPDEDVTISGISFEKLPSYKIVIEGGGKAVVDGFTDVLSGGEIAVGKNVAIASNNRGKVIASVEVRNNNADGDVFDTTGIFTMPDNDVYVKVTLKMRSDDDYPVHPLHQVTVSPVENGTVTVNPNTNVAPGTRVTITATPDSGYELEEISYTPAAGSAINITNEKEFIMPSKDVTVNVIFKPISQDALVLRVGNVTAKTGGNEVRVPVEAVYNPGYVYGSVIIGWDNSIFKLKDVVYTGLAPDAGSPAISDDVNQAGKYQISFGDDAGWLENVTETGTFFTLVFEPVEGAKEGKYDITISRVYEFINVDLGEVDSELIGGSITLKNSSISGDVNSDGVLNATDKAILNRYLAGWEGYEERILDWDAADINRDTKVNSLDKAILNRYLAGWEGYDSYFAN